MISFDAIALQIQQQVGYKLFTITRVLPDHQEVERIYTTNAEVYPVTGRKPIYDDAWTEQVIHQAQTYLASSTQEMIPFFPDLDTIKSLGLGSVINMPLVDEGKVIGTLNILDREYFYQAEHVTKLVPFAQPIITLMRSL